MFSVRAPLACLFQKLRSRQLAKELKKLDRRRLTLFLRLDYAQLNENK